MKVILEASVILYGIVFHADIGTYQTIDACNIAVKATAGPNWELSCHYESLAEQAWTNGIITGFGVCGRQCR